MWVFSEISHHSKLLTQTRQRLFGYSHTAINHGNVYAINKASLYLKYDMPYLGELNSITQEIE